MNDSKSFIILSVALADWVLVWQHFQNQIVGLSEWFEHELSINDRTFTRASGRLHKFQGHMSDFITQMEGVVKCTATHLSVQEANAAVRMEQLEDIMSQMSRSLNEVCEILGVPVNANNQYYMQCPRIEENSVRVHHVRQWQNQRAAMPQASAPEQALMSGMGPARPSGTLDPTGPPSTPTGPPSAQTVPRHISLLPPAAITSSRWAQWRLCHRLFHWRRW